MRTMFALLGVGAAAASFSPLEQQAYRRQQRSMKDVALKAAPLGGEPLAKPQYFTTKQDHFDPSNTNTWQQMYFVNDTYYKPGGDVFLCCGGEGPPFDGHVVRDSVHCNLAVEWLKDTGAILFAVQHRYYGCEGGSSLDCPVSNPQEVAGLKYQSSRQAVEDLATFHAYASKAYNVTGAKWVSFGGSYPGMVASFVRVKYPDLIHASVSSSAPVQGVLDMPGYNDVTAHAYSVSDNYVGGSPACEANIRDGHAKIGEAFKTDAGRARLASLFGMDADYYSHHDNQAAFAGNGVFGFPSQSNDPTCTGELCNIAKICVVMTDESKGDNVEKLAALVHGGEETQYWQEFDARVGKAPASAIGWGWDTYWVYQTCTEWGYYQTCEVGSKCFYTQGFVLLPDFTDGCRMFGITSDDEIQKGIDAANAYYGGRNPDATCILYVNGEVDPWRSQSILTSPKPTLDVLLVGGASHHTWTHPSAPSDQPSVVQSRKDIKAWVTRMLASDC